MKIIVERDYELMSRTVANLLLGEMFRNSRVNLAITAGSTPVKMYQYLVNAVKGRPYFENVHYYNFDEIPIKGTTGFGVTMSALNDLYFMPAEIRSENIHVLDETNYRHQDERIAADGGLDAILLGIGEDGHYCGNLPGTTKFEDGTTCVHRDAVPGMAETLAAEVGGDPDRAPEFYVTMGPKSVMQSKRIILFASGPKKAETIRKALFDPVTNDHPSSILRMHPSLTVVLDEAAAEGIKDEFHVKQSM
ncbi:6-phosphogluconolactonase [Listeria floridensis FSL S10-1187]|uniref:6-phosphogluconolactonase n=1 Tax=Listeria floridensis FSL S10-1187 TaxID=1265817 RepID=A0ABP3AX84_9LIST|nr:glucosamine-6-phosphate deaminase [Listeria floridensis]EUJ31010.1 6-phosphogluconolactonase [Listeria floridensis FSL S10-1187]